MRAERRLGVVLDREGLRTRQAVGATVHGQPSATVAIPAATSA